MGNWRTVRVVGTCDPRQVRALSQRVNVGLDYSNFGPLSNAGGICGLGAWPAPEIDRVGNLAERDYSPDAVADHLRELADVAPSLAVRVHCGGDYEDAGCVATVTLADGVVTVGPPEVTDVGSVSAAQMRENLSTQLGYR